MENCANCLYSRRWLADLDPDDVQCCRHAPPPFYNAMTGWTSTGDTHSLVTDWPVVCSGHWCGEWRPKSS
jgi:hypothetical protein